MNNSNKNNGIEKKVSEGYFTMTSSKSLDNVKLNLVMEELKKMGKLSVSQDHKYLKIGGGIIYVGPVSEKKFYLSTSYGIISW